MMLMRCGSYASICLTRAKLRYHRPGGLFTLFLGIGSHVCHWIHSAILEDIWSQAMYHFYNCWAACEKVSSPSQKFWKASYASEKAF